MGWLIISIVITIVSIVLVILDSKFYWDCTVLEILSIWGMLCGLIAIVLLCGIMIDTKSAEQLFIGEYNMAYEYSETPCDPVICKVIEINDKILENQVYSEKFMTKGLYSKEIAALPLLPVPDTMQYPIEYD